MRRIACHAPRCRSASTLTSDTGSGRQLEMQPRLARRAIRLSRGGVNARLVMGYLQMGARHVRLGRERARLLVGAAVAACSLAASVTTKAQEQPRHLEGNAAIGQDEVRARCIPTLFEPGQTCEVGAFAKVGAVAGHDFFYARYDVNDPSYPLTYPRIVIFERTASAMFQPILASGDNPPFSYGKPEIVRSAGRVLLHIAATESGTGNFNREMLYVWAKDGWRDADVTSWLDDLRRLLPDGLRVLKGVYPDYATMKAETTLWREEDGPPCPSGGLAEISLQWRGDRLAVRDMHIAKAGECGEPLPHRAPPGR